MNKLFYAICLLHLVCFSLFSQDIPKKMYLAEKCNNPIVIDGNQSEERALCQPFPHL